MRLTIGAKAHCIVSARNLWNWSGVQLQAGECYGLRVTEVQDWRDGWVDANPEGHLKVPWYLDNALARRFLRCPAAQWYALVATVGKSVERGTVVGFSTKLETNDRGELGFFANDAPFAYKNNFGTLTVEITRLQ